MSEPSSQPEVTHPEPVANGPVLFILVVLLIGILGGMYYWFVVLQNQATTPVPVPVRPTAEQNNEPESTNAEAEVESMGALSTSDEITAIEADLESTLLNNLDAELLQIEAELQSSITE